MAGGQQGLGSDTPTHIVGNGHSLLLTLQSRAEPLPLAKGGG